MPVSPRDFELYSRMTGAPMPSDAMSRMQMAPEVFEFTKNFARKPNLLEKTGNLVKNIGKSAVMAIGAPMVAESMAEQARMQEQLRNQADKTESESVTMENPTEEAAPKAKNPALEKIEGEMKLEELKQRNKMEYLAAKNAVDAGRMAGGGVVQTDLNPVQMDSYQSLLNPTTADSYGQDYVPNQTASNVVDRKISQGSQIADSTPNVAEVLSEFQDSSPGEPVEFATPEEVQQQMEAEMTGKAVSKRQLSKYMAQKGLDRALIGAAFEKKLLKPEMLGEASPLDSNLLDHPDVKDVVGGEEPTPRLVNNSRSRTNLEDHYREMRRMDAMERNKAAIDEAVDSYKNLSPSERQIMLGTKNIDSPNEMQGRITAAEESTNKLMDVVKAMGGEPSTAQQIMADQAKSRIQQKTAYKQRMAGMSTPLVEQYYPSDVARTDIQVGGMRDRKTGLGKSVGISYTPLNGDTKVGFNIMSDPTKPQDVSTFDFVASPKTMESLQSQQEGDLGALAFGKLFNIAKQKKQGFSGMEM